MANPKPRFLFIQPEIENIGIEYLSASLKQHHFPVELLFLPRPFDNIAVRLFPSSKTTETEEIIAKIKSYRPDVICFSPFTFQYAWAAKQVKLIKSRFPEIFILFGGVHVNSVPDAVIKNKSIDAVMVGEADLPIVEFAKNFFDPDKLFHTPSLWIKQKNKVIKNPLAPLVANLDKLPFPDKELFYSQIPKPLLEVTYLTMGSRGCPFACAYCSNNVYQKIYVGQKRLRFRSPENIVEELLIAKKTYNFKMVEFFDDVLTIDETRLRALMKIYRRRVHLPFTCYLHPQLVTEKIIKLLAESGCCWLKLGVQSANENYRRTYLHRNESNADIIRVAQLCHKYHLNFSFDHIFNLPGETEADLIEAVKLYRQCRPTIINFGTLFYLPGTDIINSGLKHGLLRTADVDRINQGLNPVFRLANINLFSYQNQKEHQINISTFALFFMLITTFPGAVTDLLLKLKFYRLRHRVPQPILVFFKILTKISAHQLYLYFSVFASAWYYWRSSKTVRLDTRPQLA